MSSMGYYVHLLDMNHWLNMAQKAVITKNKVRKELWTELGDSIHWDPINLNEREDYFRLSQQAFVAIQTFLLSDGKSDNLSSDQLLNWATTLADLRSRVPVARYIEMKTQVLHRDNNRVVDSGDVAVENPLVHHDV